jgi:Mg2+/citrate symporter
MIDGVRAMIDAEKALQKSGHHGKIGKFNSAEELKEFKKITELKNEETNLIHEENLLLKNEILIIIITDLMMIQSQFSFMMAYTFALSVTLYI